MLDQRRRRQTSIEPTMGQWLVFAANPITEMEPMLDKSWPTVCDAGPTLNQH